VDANHHEIIEALRRVGCTVRSLASVGRGCPDVLVGRAGSNWLLEIKDGAKPPSARKLTPDEQAFFNSWRGQVALVASVQEALDIVLPSAGR
jgi:hypothetical protein